MNCECGKNQKPLTYVDDELRCKICLKDKEEREHKIGCSKCLNGETCE